jgi:hypothetical protein
MQKSLHSLTEKSEKKSEGIALCRLTGEVSDINPHAVEIRYAGGELRYALPCYNIGQRRITKEWLNAHKNEYFVWIAYERGENPVYIGFMPSQNKALPTYMWEEYGEKFFIGVDDVLGAKISHDKAEITLVNDEIVAEADTVKVGANATEVMLLGDSTLQLMSDILDEVSRITVNTPWGVSTPPNNLTALQALKTRLDALKAKKGKVE